MVYQCLMERKVDPDPGAPVVVLVAAPVVALALVLVAPTVMLKRRERMEFLRK